MDATHGSVPGPPDHTFTAVVDGRPIRTSFMALGKTVGDEVTVHLDERAS